MLACIARYPCRAAGSLVPAARLLLAGLLLGLSFDIASAQGADDVRITPSKERAFRIPFQTQPNERRLREVQLFVSTTQGQSWKLAASAAPEQGYFQQFTAPQDGLYWFTVRTIDTKGQAFPATDAELKAGLKVLVDTVLPTVVLEALPPREGSIGVRWEARDENLEPATIRLEYQAPGANQWTPIRVDPVASGQIYWPTTTPGPFEVRMTVSDTVGNIGKGYVQIGPGSGTGALGASPQVGQAPQRIVNSKRISLNYKIDDVGPSGVSSVELWSIQPGGKWQQLGVDTAHRPPYIFEVSGEGVYGFTLLVRSGVGLGEREPRDGDPPQVWVEVDLTKPVVRLLSVDVGQGNASGTLSIAWSATDKNLGSQPITLAYAEQAEGPWTPITPTPVENTGRYIWRMPSAVPYQFFVRVEATDRAGNAGSAQTTSLVKVDLAKPKPTILEVAPAAKQP